MSPGGTMARVYLTLKDQIMSGAFVPGDRLDPARMTAELSASITPVREALHRLTGERMVESWQHEGFSVPVMTETTMRDLYSWSLELVTVVLRSARKARGLRSDTVQRSQPADFGRMLSEIAAQSPNQEHRAAIANLNDRSQMLRATELQVIGDGADLQLLASAIDDRSWGQAQILVTRHFRRRIRAVAVIAAMLPTRQSA